MGGLERAGSGGCPGKAAPAPAHRAAAAAPALRPARTASIHPTMMVSFSVKEFKGTVA